MATDQLNARELLALKRTLHDALSLTEIRAVNWGAIANASAIAFARGWRGDELAKFCVEGLARVDDPGAVIYATIRDLGKQDPPRQRTETPPPVRAVLADIHHGHQPSTRTAEHIATIRQTIGGQTP